MVSHGDATWSADSILGTGISFGTEGDYVPLGSVDQNLSKKQFSVSFWFRREVDTLYGLLSK